MLVAGINSRALWYMTRGFGLVALILLTLTMVLGLTHAVRFTRPGLPRFVLSGLHKNVSLLAVAVLAVHITTAVLDSYAPVHLADVLIPFISAYRPFWLGLGAIAVDLLIALIVTSLLRQRLGHRAWRAVHWAAYACWPVAVVHGLGTGSDIKLGAVLLLNVVCIGSVLAALWWRLAAGWSSTTTKRRGPALLASIVLPIALAVWTVSGPLRPGWAKRAGTPTAQLGSRATAAASSPATAGGSVASGALGAHLATPFTATFKGTQHRSGPDASGLVSLTIAADFHVPQRGRLTIVLTGPPANGGGVQLTGSHVTIGPTSDPSQYTGHVTRLQGSTVVAQLSDATGKTVTATVQLHLIPASSRLTGSVEMTA